ncbi:endonuclease V [Xanthovirga aplysinae]|uniref:endonuclease V n=1 Tax=Xanthovirga aplysinae TaxID=2529853 RepID=UPI0012BCD768|nr:endonuclease V [Xanthovirga aplysinae]MTI31279.1 endonuclease V [Xanthovirga aplysinae]
MIVAFDVQYYDDYAKAIGLGFDNWRDSKPKLILAQKIYGVKEYVSGEFYKRELPCILTLLKKFDLENIELIIIDGYVQLNKDGKLGLGGYLYKALNGKIPVIGIAKSSFYSAKGIIKELIRGQSKKPLYISSIGIESVKACKLIKSMSGDYRIPTLLQILDSKTKEK